MICLSCCEIEAGNYENTDGLCWECHNERLENWVSPPAKKTIQVQATVNDTTHVHEKRYQAETLSNPSVGCNGFWISSPQDLEQYKQNQSKYIKASAELDKLNAIKTTTLPTDSAERKNYPLFRGLLRYFPAALAGVSNTSQKGNDKHNPGQDLHHARSKSGDHADCILRHLMDLTDLLAARDRGAEVSDEQIKDEVNSACWRMLALSQEIHESLGYPLAPGAKE
jgi:hypothetical protein